MPDPRTLLSLYPPTNLKDTILERGFKQLNVYVDIKNVMTSLFLEDVINEIALNSINTKMIDSSIFQSFLMYTSWWKRFSNLCNIPLNIFFITDNGTSEYHTNIYKFYKQNRTIASSTTPIYYEDFREVKYKNFDLANSILRNIPNTYFITLSRLESDFVSYFLISRKFSNPETLHIVCSNDHDMYQNFKINDNHILQLFKSQSGRRLLGKSNILPHYFGLSGRSIDARQKVQEKLSNFDIQYIDAIMGINGDPGDDVPGVNGFGLIRLLDLFSDKKSLLKLVGTPEELQERVANGGNFFKEYVSSSDFGKWVKLLESKTIDKKVGNNDKIYDLNELVTNSFKLVSFEQLCLWLEKADDLKKIEWVKYINDTVDKHIGVGFKKDDLMTVLKGIPDNYLTESEIDILFY